MRSHDYDNDGRRFKHPIPPEFIDIADFCDLYTDLPDGAFFGVAAEHGFSIDDFAAWAEWENKYRPWEVVDGVCKYLESAFEEVETNGVS